MSDPYWQMKVSLTKAVAANEKATPKLFAATYQEEFGEEPPGALMELFQKELLEKDVRKPPAREAAEKTPPMKILVAEDEFAARKKVEKILKDQGHKVLMAENGKEAWDLWQKYRPRMVITDWLMPEMDGVSLCKKIRENEGSQYTYLIVITTKQGTDNLLTAMDSGADEFIVKPYLREELSARVRAGARILQIHVRDGAIFSIAKLAENWDIHRKNHLERIRYSALALTKTLDAMESFPKEINKLFRDNIFLTAVLHDIGHIGLPDHLLTCPDKLDAEAFQQVKEHTRIGHEVLMEALVPGARTEYLEMAAQIARSHHERYDGTGYPDGLKGDEIPLAARIVCLCDVYDALTNTRPYRKAYTHDMAVGVIMDQKGKQFDPKIVEAFLECEKDFINIAKVFSL